MPLAVIFSLCSLRRARLQIFLSAVLLNPAFPVVFLPKARSYFSSTSQPLPALRALLLSIRWLLIRESQLQFV